MKIDIYHLYRHFEYSNFVYPILMDVLKIWAEEIGIEARVHVCREEQVNDHTDADAVAFSVYTQTALASYRVSRRLRERGKVVIFGGPHFRNSDCQEALAHCDVVAGSICQEQWVGLLRHIQSGKLKPNRDRAIVMHDTRSQFEYPQNFFRAFKSQKWFQIPSVPTSIGCPYNCTFCNAYLPGHYKLRSIDTICNELSRTPGKTVVICDATFGLNKRFTIELMKRIAPLEKKLFVETSLARLRDQELLDALAEGGIRWVSVGIESLSQRLKKHGSATLDESLRQVIDDLHRRGILMQGNLICGLDSDGPDSFERIYDFYRLSNLDLLLVDLLTPYPNTDLYRSLVAEDRIIDHNWEHYDYRHVVYRPKRMTPEQLIDGFTELWRSITKPKMVLNKAMRILRQVGLSFESSVLIAFNMFSRVDASRRRRSLMRNRQQITTRPIVARDQRHLPAHRGTAAWDDGFGKPPSLSASAGVASQLLQYQRRGACENPDVAEVGASP